MDLLLNVKKTPHKFFALNINCLNAASHLIAQTFLFLSLIGLITGTANAAWQEFNSSGGTNPTNGLHIYIDDSTQMQIKRFDNTGQLYSPSNTPPNLQLDNGIFLRANGSIFGPSNFSFNALPYTTTTTSLVTPSNHAVIGQEQSATSNFGITSGPQITVQWKYDTPNDYITAEVTIVIPPSYPISSSNPVRYYHVVDSFLGGSDNGCGVKYIDSNGKMIVGTYSSVSGTTCPTISAVPAGVNLVESFRERTGNFSNYCATAWNAFWDYSQFLREGCSIVNENDLTNTISNASQNTGIGIEYSFSSAGTYTFSYDFVVGSTLAPVYDHLEIRHPGTTSLCPATVTVLACTSSTVPCPATNIVSTGELTGSVVNSPISPSITKTPSTFTLGSGASTASVVLQGSAAGTYTLAGSNLSATPINGTRCWNTTTNTASCSFTVTNSPCASKFECLETALSYNNLVSNPSSRNPLYTKVAGSGFAFDIVALQSNGDIATDYTASSGVTVELFDDTITPQPSCSSYISPIASQSITFSAGDKGRKTLSSNFTIANAYRKLRCRVKELNLSLYGCSSDDFAVRPSGFTVTTSNANADLLYGNSPTATPIIKAGNNISLSANSGVIGYDGTPLIDAVKVSAHSGAALVGTLSGSFSQANSATGSSTGSSFKYSEVGYFKLAANGVYDNSFTLVDSIHGDCANGFNASGGKNACSFGNAIPSDYFGRFYPDHFAVIQGASTPACSNAFSYYGQDGLSTGFILTAQNSSNTTTQNYTGIFAKLGINTWTNFNFTAASMPAGASLSASATSPTGNWSNGSATILAKHLISRPTTTSAPSNISISLSPVDSDGVTMLSSLAAPASPYRFGRLLISNAYGSELLPLTIPIEAQYWNGNAYQRNQLDSCTNIPAVSIAMGNYKSNLAPCNTQLSGAGVMVNGKTVVILSKPGNGKNGSVDLTENLNTPSGTVCTSSSESPASSAAITWFGPNNPTARATFGIFKTPIIYIRENF